MTIGNFINYERVKGIEPSYLAWKASALAVVLHPQEFQTNYIITKENLFEAKKRAQVSFIKTGLPELVWRSHRSVHI